MLKPVMTGVGLKTEVANLLRSKAENANPSHTLIEHINSI